MDQRIIDQVIEGNNIVSIVEQYLPLKKSGSNYKACCPFHEEKTPSFVVSEKKQIFKCFGCGKGGNAIHFIMEMEKIPFFEALERLAVKAGVKLQKKGTKTESRVRSRQELLLKVYDLAKDYYTENLQRFGDNPVRMLEERGISRQTIEQFELGYALNGTTGLLNYLQKCDINRDLLKQSGLFVSTQKGLLDLFRERLIFPIHSAQGNVVAFGARLLFPDQKGGKYINSPTTELYTKGKELYGFYLTRHEIRKLDYALVTEGYTDFLRLYENGFTNSVATLGTAFTNEQIKLLSRYSKNIYLLYDGDLAGRKAAVKAAENILIARANPRIVNLPDGEDADSFLKNQQKEGLKKLINNALPLVTYLYKNSDLGMTDKEKLEMLLETANQMEDLLERELFLKDIATQFSISLTSLSQRIRRRRTQRDKIVTATPDKKFLKRFLEEENFLICLLNGMLEDKSELGDVDSSYFFNEQYQKVFEILQRFDYIVDNERIASILAELEEDDAMQIKIISELSLAEVPPVPFEAVINDLRIRKYQNELRNLDDSMSSDQDKASHFRRKKELLEKIRNSSRKVIHKNRI